MTTKRLPVLLSLILLSLLLSVAGAAPVDWLPPVTLIANDGGAEDHFGSTVALQGDVGFIGAPGWDSATADDVGAAYVFTHDGTGWQQRQRLLAPDGRRGESFGSGFAVDGQTLLIGAFGAHRGDFRDADVEFSVGAIYVYSGSGDNWTYQTKLMPAELASGSGFGRIMALEGDTLLVGTPYYGNGGESVFAYRRGGGNWGTPQIISPPATAPGYFGQAVAVSGNVALVGAPGVNCCDQFAEFEKGVVYIYTRSGNTWSPAGSIRPADGFDGDNFGCAIDFDGTTAVIASCQGFGLPNSYTFAHVFTRNGATFTPAARLEPEGDTPHPNGSGEIVSATLAGDTLALGTYSAPDADGGRLYVYERAGGQWALATTLNSPDGREMTDFGNAVALNDEHLLAGDYQMPRLNVEEQGGVFAYRRAGGPTYTVFAPVVAAPAPDSSDGLIAYMARGNANEYDIFLIRPDGTGKTNLTHSPESEMFPAWSADGTRLAFMRQAPLGPQTLVTSNAAGGDVRVVITAASPSPLWSISSPTWSPDGRRLAFSSNTNNGFEIFVINADGTGLRSLTPNLPYHNEMPAWSPDGTKIAFSNAPGGEPWRLALASPAGGPITFLGDAEAGYYAPDWSPDGSRILFQRGVNFRPWLFTIPAGGGAETPLFGEAGVGRWSPDGSRIVFNGSAGGIFVANADGTGLAAVDATEDAGYADWQP